MASGTSDLQRDLGGAIMQSILGAVLTAGYSASIAAAVANSPNQDKVTDGVQAQLEKSFSSAAEVAEQYPKYADQIIAAARSSFLDGDHRAYLAGIIAILLGALIVRFRFPGKEDEARLHREYAAEDARWQSPTAGDAEPARGI